MNTSHKDTPTSASSLASLVLQLLLRLRVNMGLNMGSRTLPVFAKVFFVFVFFSLPLSGCAGNNSAGPAPATPFEQMGGYALDGPDFVVIGDLSGLPLEGFMQRKAMVGVGKLKLYSTEDPPSLICESIINTRPNEKRRVRGILDCNDGNIILFTLRPLGPDQGLGIGTAVSASGTPHTPQASSSAGHPLQKNEQSSPAASPGIKKDLTIFYHPSKDEGQRRFPQILDDFTALRQEKRP